MSPCPLHTHFRKHCFYAKQRVLGTEITIISNMEHILSFKFLQPMGPVLLAPNWGHKVSQQNHQRGCKPLAALQGSEDESGQELPFPRPSIRAEKDNAKRAAVRIWNRWGTKEGDGEKGGQECHREEADTPGQAGSRTLLPSEPPHSHFQVSLHPQKVQGAPVNACAAASPPGLRVEGWPCVTFTV